MTSADASSAGSEGLKQQSWGEAGPQEGAEIQARGDANAVCPCRIDNAGEGRCMAADGARIIDNIGYFLLPPMQSDMSTTS